MIDPLVQRPMSSDSSLTELARDEEACIFLPLPGLDFWRSPALLLSARLCEWGSSGEQRARVHKEK